MPKSQKDFKRPPKKYQPRGVSILYEDHDILVVDKISGLLTVSNDKVKENTAYYLLTNYVRKGNPKSKNRIFIVHRLDR
ncbi:MAG: RNA pseudouridine synthase, partial [Deltaproteobacteria bacterium]|nr:RNA pseudouridine synthase [Deltaproteobacteria bacterium]